jgi:hypothetical protein
LHFDNLETSNLLKHFIEKKTIASRHFPDKVFIVMHIDTLNPNDPTCKQLAKEMWEDEQLEKDMETFWELEADHLRDIGE